MSLYLASLKKKTKGFSSPTKKFYSITFRIENLRFSLSKEKMNKGFVIK